MEKDKHYNNRVVFFCDDDVHERLKIEADKNVLTRGQYVRMILNRHLNEVANEPK